MERRRFTPEFKLEAVRLYPARILMRLFQFVTACAWNDYSIPRHRFGYTQRQARR
jgi:hypothetical protein